MRRGHQKSSLQKQTFWCTHLTTHACLSPSLWTGWGANARLWLTRDLRQRPCPVTPTLDPNKCWQAQPQARLSSCGTEGCFPHSPRQWEGRRQRAEGGFSQLIILGKGRYKFHGWNARVVKCRRRPKEGPGLSFQEGSGRRAGKGRREKNRLPRGAAFLGSRKSGSRKKEIPWS